MKSRMKKKYGFGSVISSVGAVVPDPVTKAILIASGIGINFAEDAMKKQKLNASYRIQDGVASQMETGGEVDALVERGEVVKPSDGSKPYLVKGGSHESGNDTKISEPPGTEVYSNDVSIKGKSMAEYESSRMRKEKKMIKRLEKLSEMKGEATMSAPVANMIQWETKNIMEELSDISEERNAHMAVQQILFNASQHKDTPEMGKGGKMRKYEVGSNITPSSIQEMLAMLNADKRYSVLDDQAREQLAAQIGASVDPNTGKYFMNSTDSSGYRYDDATLPVKSEVASDKNTNLPGNSGSGSVTAKDIYGYADLGALAINLLNYKNEPNYYEGYGDRGLATNSLTMDVIGANRDSQLRRSRLGRNTSAYAIRNASGSTNQYLANMAANDAVYNENEQAISQNYDNQIAQALSNRTNLLNNQDSVLANSRTRLYDSKERRWDNVTSQFAKAVKNAALSSADNSSSSTTNAVDKKELISLLYSLIK